MVLETKTGRQEDHCGEELEDRWTLGLFWVESIGLWRLDTKQGGESNVLGLDLGLNTSREGKAALWDWAEQWGLVPVEEERRWSGASSKCHQEVGEGEVGWLEFFQQGQRKFNEIWVAKSLGSLSCYGTEQRASASGDAQSSLPRSGA